MKLKQFIFALVAMLLSFVSPAFAQNVAKVGNTEYATIDEAIDKWTNGTTLALLADVTLSDVIKLSSTEHHILDLGTFTMTAASGKNAIEIVNNGRSSASYALDIKADATNPGGITAKSATVVKTTGKSGVKDRPIIRFYNGVFTGNNVIYHSGSNGTNCPQFQFYGGVFNGTVYANRALIQFYGGTFNGSLQMSVDSSAYGLVAGGRFKQLSNLYMSALNSGKFTIGSAKGVYDRGIYVDKDGYYVVTSEVIKEVSAKYPAVKKESYNSNNYFYYSAAAANGMFYEVASMATGSNVTVYEHAEVVEELDNNAAVKDFTPELPSEVKTFEVEAIDIEATTEATTKVTFNVEPKNASGAKVSNPSAAITFRLPVPAAWSGKANVYHEDTLLGAYTIKEESGAKYVEVSSSSFSEFSVEAIVPTEVEVATLAELQAALADNSNELPIIITETIVIPEGETVVLDLNGKTVTRQDEANQYALRNLGDLTIKDTKGNGSINARGIYNGYGNGGANVATAKITVVNGTINAKGTNGGGAAIFNYGVADIQGGTFTSVASYAIALQTGSTMTIGENAIITGGINSWQSTLTITGGTISNDKSGKHVVYAGESAVTINGGTFHNNNSGNATIMASGSTAAVEITGGTLIINGGTFSNDNFGENSLATAARGAILADTKAKVEINGGTFNVLKNVIDIQNNLGDANNNPSVLLVGGTYSADPRISAQYASNLITLAENCIAVENNGVWNVVKVAAKIGEQGYNTLEEAFKAATSGCTIDILSDVTVDYAWDARKTGAKFTVPVTINGNGKTIKFTASVNDNNYQAPFRFEADATVKNLTIDMSEVTDNRFRAISSKGNLTVDGCKFIGKDESLNCRAIIFGEGAGANVGNLAISITNSEFINWKRGITDNENAQDVKTVTITGNKMTDAGVGVSAKETVTFTGNTVAGAYVNIKSYTANNKLAVTATGNTLEANTDESGKFNVIDAGGVVNAEGFKVVAKGNNFLGYTSTEGIWGEVWGNARESFVIKVLDANDNVMGTTSLNNVGGIIDGDVNVSWNLKFNAAANTDEYWTMEWTTAPTLNNMPAKVELWVDGTRVGGGPVVLNGPDDLNKINVIVTDADGKITSCQTTVANALAAAKDGETVNLLWKDGQAPLAMNGAVFGKNVTIAGTAKVDWNKGFLFVGRGGAGNATVTFDGANLTSASNSSSYGIHVSGREKNTTNKYDGTLVIKNSTIELDYLINRNAIELDNATLTVKNGFAIAGRPASETENAANATATISLANGSKVVVNNHNGMGLGQAASVLEGFGVMNVDATSAFETTQGFVVTVNGTMNIAGNATIAGTLTNEGAINLTSENATLKAQAGLTINSTVEGRDVIYADGVYTTKLGLKGKGTEAEPYLIYNVNELMAFRNSVNEGETKYSAPGVYVALAADIDMAGENWVGIGSATADHGFMGNFDGKNFKIKNLTIDNPTLDSDGYAYAGLFGVTEGTDKDNQNTIKNLTIENVTINTTGDIVSAAIAYPYYTIVDNVKVCGDIKIQGGKYTAGVLAYTRRCVNASNLSIVGNAGSYVKGTQTVGGVISDIQMNGGLTAVYSNFSAEGISVTGEKSVGGIAGIIATQTLNGATVKNVTLSSQDAFAGVVAGRLGGTSTISNVVSENVTGATAVIGATFDGAKAVAAKIGDTYYATLEAALAAQGNEVELLATYEVAAGETKTLDLKGKTVTMVYTAKATKNHTMVSNSGNLTIESSVEGGKLSYTYAGEDLGVSYSTNTVTSNPGSVLTVKSGTIENLTYDKSVIAYAIDGLTNGGAGDVTVNIEGGVITSKRQAVRIFANSTTNTGALNISGGDITGRVIVQNANANANKAVLNITAGTFNANEYKSDVLYVGGSSSATIDINASVSGGTFNGEITETNVAGFITGGKYKTDVNQFCALGYQAKANAGLYTVEYTGKVAEFTIVDGEYTEFNIEKEVKVGKLTYERNFSAANRWNALYVPFEIPVELLTQAGYEVAYVNDVHSYDNLDVDGTPGEDGVIDDMKMEVILIKNGKLNANYPYLIRANSAGLLSLEIENAKLYTTEEKSVSCSSVFMKFEVTGIYESKTASELGDANSIYALGGGVWTLPESPNQQLKPFRLYLKATKIDGSPVVVDESTLANIRIRVAGEKDEVTGIITPIIEGDVHVNDGTVYDLMGRPVRTPEKGKIYIMNGKKVLF